MQKWLTPRLHRLHAKFPDLRVDWHTSREAVDFARSDYHAAVRLGEGVTPGLDHDKLMDEWLVVVASPELFKKHGSIDDRDTLQRHSDAAGARRALGALREERGADALARGPDDHRRLGERAVGCDRGPRLRAGALVDRRATTSISGNLELASKMIVPSRFRYWFVCPPSYSELPMVLRAAPVAARGGRAFPEARRLAEPPLPR